MSEYQLQLNEDQKKKLEELWEVRDMGGYRNMIWSVVANIFPLRVGEDAITSSSLDHLGVLTVTVGKKERQAEMNDQIKTEIAN